MRAEIPRGRPHADGACAAHTLEGVGGAQEEIALGLVAQRRIQLVDPPVDPKLVALAHDATLLVGVDQSRHRRDVEGGGDVVAGEEGQDARHADAVAVLAPAEPTDGGAAIAQLVGLVVGVEGQRDGAARAARPFRGPERPAGTDMVDDGTPLLLWPLPGLNSYRIVRHRVLLDAPASHHARSRDERLGTLLESVKARDTGAKPRRPARATLSGPKAQYSRAPAPRRGSAARSLSPATRLHHRH